MLLEDFCKKIDAVPMSVIEDIKNEIRKYLEDECINENEAEGIMFCLDVIDIQMRKRGESE